MGARAADVGVQVPGTVTPRGRGKARPGRRGRASPPPSWGAGTPGRRPGEQQNLSGRRFLRGCNALGRKFSESLCRWLGRGWREGLRKRPSTGPVPSVHCAGKVRSPVCEPPPRPSKAGRKTRVLLRDAVNHECVSVSNSWPDTVAVWPVWNRCLEEEEERGGALEKTEVGGSAACTSGWDGAPQEP